MNCCLRCILAKVILALGLVASASELAIPPKATVPDAAALEAAQKAADELFGTRFRSAKTAADKSAVAAEMIEAALKLQDGSADQYVLLKIAREIAVGAGDAATALQAAEEQAKRFDVPAAKLKAETLLAAAREAKATAQQKAVAEAALQLVARLDGRKRNRVAPECLRSRPLGGSEIPAVRLGQGTGRPSRRPEEATQSRPGISRGAGRHGQGPRRTGCEPDGRAIPVLRRRGLGTRRALSGPGQRRGLEGRGSPRAARGRFGRCASRDRRHVVGLGRDKARFRSGTRCCSAPGPGIGRPSRICRAAWRV